MNGVAAWLVTHALFFGGSYGLGLFDAGIVFDQFGAILATLVLFALVFCRFLYVEGTLSGRARPTAASPATSSGTTTGASSSTRGSSASI